MENREKRSKILVCKVFTFISYLVEQDLYSNIFFVFLSSFDALKNKRTNDDVYDKIFLYSLNFLVCCIFPSAIIRDGDWSISRITFSDWFIFVTVNKRSKQEKQRPYKHNFLYENSTKFTSKNFTDIKGSEP